MSSLDPPPSYEEAVKPSSISSATSGNDNKEHHAAASSTSYYADRPPGPAWLHYYPQPTQYSSPQTSLQYEDFDGCWDGGANGRLPPPSPIEVDLGEDPVQLMCPYCRQVVVTVTTTEVGWLAYLISTVLCVVGCWPCALLPCCIRDFLDVAHSCPNCDRHLQTHTKGFD